MGSQIRRVVTGHDESGKAIVILDGPAPFVHDNPKFIGLRSIDIWRTGEMPATIAAQHDDTTLGPRRQVPTENGTVVRITRFPPETEAVRNMSIEEAREAFSALGNEAASTFGRGGQHPLMHRTETIDYAIILSGEINLLLDDADVLLKTGDVVVQCGTNHAWNNRSGEDCMVAFVLIDGKYDSGLRKTLQVDG